MSSGLAQFKVDLNAMGRGSVELNGEDVAKRVSSLEFQARTGQPPLLTLHYIAANGSIEGEGIVQVIAEDFRPQEEMAKFLQAIDPGQLGEAVLERAGMGDDTMEVVLQVLTEWASGRDNT